MTIAKQGSMNAPTKRNSLGDLLLASGSIEQDPISLSRPNRPHFSIHVAINAPNAHAHVLATITAKYCLLYNFGYSRGCDIITYLLIVMARTVNNDTATRAYLARGNILHSVRPCAQDLLQNVDAARGRLKQQNRRSEHDKFIMNTAVALRTCE